MTDDGDDLVDYADRVIQESDGSKSADLEDMAGLRIRPPGELQGAYLQLRMESHRSARIFDQSGTPVIGPDAGPTHRIELGALMGHTMNELPQGTKWKIDVGDGWRKVRTLSKSKIIKFDVQYGGKLTPPLIPRPEGAPEICVPFKKTPANSRKTFVVKVKITQPGEEAVTLEMPIRACLSKSRWKDTNQTRPPHSQASLNTFLNRHFTEGQRPFFRNDQTWFMNDLTDGLKNELRNLSVKNISLDRPVVQFVPSSEKIKDNLAQTMFKFPPPGNTRTDTIYQVIVRQDTVAEDSNKMMNVQDFRAMLKHEQYRVRYLSQLAQIPNSLANRLNTRLQAFSQRHKRIKNLVDVQTVFADYKWHHKINKWRSNWRLKAVTGMFCGSYRKLLDLLEKTERDSQQKVVRGQIRKDLIKQLRQVYDGIPPEIAEIKHPRAKKEYRIDPPPEIPGE